MFLKRSFLYISWITSLVAFFGSLYFSEILKLAPCFLCWYQRIFMYPLLLILPVGILLKDKNISLYVLPLSILGLITAFYHNSIYYGFVKEITACAFGVPCVTRQIEWFGFITIPLLSFFSFAIITICMLLYRKAK